MKARRFWSAHRYSCTARGVELQDVESIAWEVFTDAVNAWTPESGSNFTAFFDYPFRNRIAELLNIRTERGRREPLNYADSLNRPLDADDSDGASLLDVVDDPDADFIDDLLDGLDAEQEAKAVREAVESLPEQLREVITLHYFEGLTLRQIGKRLEVTGQRVAMIEQEALRRLRQDRRLRLVYLDSEEQKRLARAAAKPTGTGAAPGADRVHPLLSAYMTDATRQALDLLNLMQRETIAAYLAGDTPEQRAADSLLEMI
jgi:RNA polymerase sigma factor (sigma-70 family)